MILSRCDTCQSLIWPFQKFDWFVERSGRMTRWHATCRAARRQRRLRQETIIGHVDIDPRWSIYADLSELEKRAMAGDR